LYHDACVVTATRYAAFMSTKQTYPIGTPGTPWGEAERTQWRERQQKIRSVDEIFARVRALGGRFDVVTYGEASGHPLLAVTTRAWRTELPAALITGGVHGYETSGVLGALAFLEERAGDFDGRINLIAAPCVSPWAFERVQRWNERALDPNRSFKDGGEAAESVALRAFIAPWRDVVVCHVDLHETTDSDESTIPDGFYLVDDSGRPQLSFQRAIIAAVAPITQIAPADDKGELIGCPVKSPGVIEYDVRGLGLCTALTNAAFTTTTEVYPDSPKATPAQCTRAQVAAVCAAIDFVTARWKR
jgi:hypothetical protein